MKIITIHGRTRRKSRRRKKNKQKSMNGSVVLFATFGILLSPVRSFFLFRILFYLFHCVFSGNMWRQLESHIKSTQQKSDTHTKKCQKNSIQMQMTLLLWSNEKWKYLLFLRRHQMNPKGGGRTQCSFDFENNSNKTKQNEFLSRGDNRNKMKTLLIR